MLNTQEKDICENHKRIYIYYCLEPNCKKNTLCCILCVKNDHSNCHDDLILNREEASEKIKFLKNENDSKFIINKLNRIFELKIYELNMALLRKKKFFLDSFNI